jgi:hypothetical protein
MQWLLASDVVRWQSWLDKGRSVSLEIAMAFRREKLLHTTLRLIAVSERVFRGSGSNRRLRSGVVVRGRQDSGVVAIFIERGPSLIVSE